MSAVVLLSAFSLTASAAAPYAGYNYDAKGRPVASPNGYVPDQIVLGANYGIGNFSRPQDVAVDGRGQIYIADTGNNRIIMLDEQLKLIRVVDSFLLNDRPETLKEPSGIFVDHQDRMYIADTGNRRIVISDQEGRMLGSLGQPQSELLPDQFLYDPYRLAVDRSGLIYVLSKNTNMGIMLIDSSGHFIGFYGANCIGSTMQLVAELFWRSVMTKEQIAKMKAFTPLAVSSLHMDNNDFVYTVTGFSETGKDQIRKLNPKGTNVLASGAYGDRDMPKDLETAFIDITSDDRGFFYALDHRMGRIFQYDQDNNLLAIFGGKGNRKGTFKEPVAIAQANGRVLVLDSGKNSLTIFKPTAYAEALMDAVYKYSHGMYDEALEPWRHVLERNSNFDLAHTGIGNALLQTAQYEEAMANFGRSEEREGFSKAKREYRTLVLREHFTLAAIALVAAGAAIWLIVRMRDRKRAAEGVKSYKRMNTYVFPLYIMLHPVDGYQEMVWNKRTSVKSSFVILASFFVTAILYRQQLDFVFNLNDPDKLNVPLVFMSTIALFAVAVVCNWCFSTLMDGEGSFREIWVTCSYALLPSIIANIVTIILSKLFVKEEAFFLDYITVIGQLWSLVLVVIALKVIHDYTVKGTLFSIGLTVAGMMIVMFLTILGYALAQQVYAFAANLYSEAMFRWS